MNMKRCPNCGIMLGQNKKICPKCNYNFKKSKVDKPKVTKPIHKKHFDNCIVSFDYPDYYSKDFNSKYMEIGILASFKIGSGYILIVLLPYLMENLHLIKFQIPNLKK